MDLRSLAVLIAVVLAASGASVADESADLARLRDQLSVAQDADRGWSERVTALLRIGRSSAGHQLLPEVRTVLRTATSKHVQLGALYVLAAQGDRAALVQIADFLDDPGQYGASYLSELCGTGIGWAPNKWRSYLQGVTGEQWRTFVLRRFSARTPTDADEEGLRAAVAWWDGAGFAGRDALEFVRFRSAESTGPKRHTEPWEYGIIVSTGLLARAIVGTDLVVRPLKKHSGKRGWTVEKLPLVVQVREDLGAYKASGSGDASGVEDPFGIESGLHPCRFRGFLLVRALVAKGSDPLALELWRVLAANEPAVPEYGGWSGLLAMRDELFEHLADSWELEFERKDLSLSKQRRNFGALVSRLGLTAHDDRVSTTLGILAGMTRVERGRERLRQKAEKTGATSDQVEALIGMLAETHADDLDQEGSTFGKLVQVGRAAVPELLVALDDHGFTRVTALRSYSVGSKGGRENVRVHSIVRKIIQRITGIRMASGERGREEIRAWLRDGERR